MPFCAENFDFSILIITEQGVSRSYCGAQQSFTGLLPFARQERNFVALHYDGYNPTGTGANVWDGVQSGHTYDQVKFSSGELYEKVRYMKSCSFNDYTWDGNVGEACVSKSSAEYFLSDDGFGVYLDGHDFYNDSPGAGTDAGRVCSTGSLHFYQKTGVKDPVKSVKFWGQKVCDIFGIPENVWMDMDAVRISADSGSRHSVRGDLTATSLTVTDRLVIPYSADIGGHIPFKVHYNTTDKYLRFIDCWGDGATAHRNRILIGYQYDTTDHQYPDGTPLQGLDGSNARFKIATSGMVGAGLLNPRYYLHVSASNNKTAAYFQGNVQFESDAGTDSGFLKGDSEGLTVNKNQSGYTRFIIDNSKNTIPGSNSGQPQGGMTLRYRSGSTDVGALYYNNSQNSGDFTLQNTRDGGGFRVVLDDMDNNDYEVFRLRMKTNLANDPLLKIQGHSGSLFEIHDTFEESYFSVNDISGVPIIDCKSTDSTWIMPILQNNWVQFDNIYNPPGYFKDAMGFVHLRGLVKNGSSANSIIFTLPPGYRPPFRELVIVYSDAGACRVNIRSSGIVETITGGSTTWTSLDNISFYVGLSSY